MGKESIRFVHTHILESSRYQSRNIWSSYESFEFGRKQERLRVFGRAHQEERCISRQTNYKEKRYPRRYPSSTNWKLRKLMNYQKSELLENYVSSKSSALFTGKELPVLITFRCLLNFRYRIHKSLQSLYKPPELEFFYRTRIELGRTGIRIEFGSL